MKKLLSIILAVIMNVVLLSGCGRSENSTSQHPNLNSDSNNTALSGAETFQNEGPVNGCYVKINDYRLGTDSKGERCIVVYYSLKNLTDEETGVDMRVREEVRQGFICASSYEDVICDDGKKANFSDSFYDDAKPGETVEVFGVFYLEDETTPVEVTIVTGYNEEHTLDHNKVVKTFEIA